MHDKEDMKKKDMMKAGKMMKMKAGYHEEVEEKSTEELSGFPFVAESVKLDDHIPSNSILLFFFLTFKFSIISPVKELWDSNILTISFEFINYFVIK